jgi:hypothetical protein
LLILLFSAYNSTNPAIYYAFLSPGAYTVKLFTTVI